MDEEKRARLRAEPQPGLLAAVKVADAILSAVAELHFEGDGPRADDEAESFLVAAYGRMFRCFRAIRDLAAPPVSDAASALTLTRSMVSTAARSLWIAKPEHAVVRAQRFDQWQLSFVEEERATIRGLRKQGFRVDEALEQAVERRRLELKQKRVKAMPSDRRLLDEIGLANVYDRVHRPGSEATHYSLGSALLGFAEAPRLGRLEGRLVVLEQPDFDSAELALIWASIVYGAFLTSCRPVIPHFAAAVALERLQEYMTVYGEASSGENLRP